MLPYAAFDLHCDTLTDTHIPNALQIDTLNRPTNHLVLSALPKETRWAQCYAVFIPDPYTGKGADTYYHDYQASFARQMEKFSDLVTQCRSAAEIESAWAAGKAAAILTIENGSALAGDLNRVDVLARDGVKMITLTWNGENEIASGSTTDHGLSAFGREVIPAMEQNGILVDVSHLNDTGFYELLDVAKKPFVASHSNARAVCGHKRNLTDDQIREMAARRCLIGLNYFTLFLRDDGNPQPEDLLRHIDRFLDLGAEDCLALGSDFDGAVIPDWLLGPQKVVELYDLLLQRGYCAELCDKLFYRNALEFFRTNL